MVSNSSRELQFSEITDFQSKHPERVLGPSFADGSFKITAYLPLAEKAWIEVNDKKYEMYEIKDKLFESDLPKLKHTNDYTICYSETGGYTSRAHDPYAFNPLLTEFETYLFKKGDFLRAYDVFGSHIVKYPETSGTRFVVWAPNAQAVSVIGNFNHWRHGSHPMTNVRDSGIWELYIPTISDGEVYKYAIKTPDGRIVEKTDPFAFKTEMRPRTASVVFSSSHQWNDLEYLEGRSQKKARERQISIYEVHLGSWRRRPNGDFMTYEEIAKELVPYVANLGFSHVEIMPVMEHPLDASWGYQVINYYSPTSRFGSPDSLRVLIDEFHSRGIGVILDWVPAHFPKDDYGLRLFDGTHMFEHPDPRRGEHPDWGTNIFDFSKGEVVSFLLSNALFWLEQYHADGIRMDAVSSMLYLDYSRGPNQYLPNQFGGNENLEAIEFLKKLNNSIHIRFPGAMSIAEESTAWGGVTKETQNGGLGFDFKWNMGWMHDTLSYLSLDPVYRRFHQGSLTFSMWYAFSESYILPLSHDEVVHGKGSIYSKMPGDAWQKLANARLLYSYMFSFPGKKLMFMGDEFVQSNEWDFNRSITWAESESSRRSEIVKMIGDLNLLYSNNGFLTLSDLDSRYFRWIDFSDSSSSVISFVRGSANSESFMMFVFNFTPVVRENYRLGAPKEGVYEEIFNSDSGYYGGGGIGNLGKLLTKRISSHGFENSLEITLPPLGCLIFKHSEDK